MNLIIGSAAGTFSTVLKYLSWMSISDILENQISLQFHWANKTDFNGNTFFNYGRIKKDQLHNDFLSRDNLMNYLFKGQNLKPFSDFDEYIECYPHECIDVVKKFPDFLTKYNGGGWNVLQYSDNKYLPIIRNTYNHHWNTFKISNNTQSKLNEESKLISNKKILTVMVRCSAHYLETDVLMNNLIQDVKNKMNDYDNILLLTQVQEVFDLFVKTFGNLCIFPERERISGDVDWKGGRGVCMSNEEYFQEVEECLIDVLLASQTSHVMSGASNMFLGTLVINPEITFDLFESLKQFNGA